MSRKERVPKREQLAQYFTITNPGTNLFDAQRTIYDEAVSGLQRRDIDQDAELVGAVKEWRKQDPRKRIPPEPRGLPARAGMDELMNIIQNMHRDIRFIKDAQSKVGAQHWIDEHGYKDSLQVVDEDIDGDGVPDVIVKTRDNKPYIVKGYTTAQSDYPYRYQYYTKYPLKEDREGHSYRDWLEGHLVRETKYDPEENRFVRTYNPGISESIDRSRAAGYRLKLPSKKVGMVSIFNARIIKPIIEGIKNVAISIASAEGKTNYQFKLEASVLHKIEAFIRANVVSLPVLYASYDEEKIKSLDQDTINTLLMKKPIKEACNQMIIKIINNFNDIPNLGLNIIQAIVEILGTNNRLPFDDWGGDMNKFYGQVNGFVNAVAQFMKDKVAGRT